MGISKDDVSCLKLTVCMQKNLGLQYVVIEIFEIHQIVIPGDEAHICKEFNKEKLGVGNVSLKKKKKI